MMCKATGISYYDCDFSTHSGQVSTPVCSLNSGTTGVYHVVTVTPIIAKYHDIRVRGRIVSSPRTAKANFCGASVGSGGVEWEETKSISTVDVTFQSAEIVFVKSGTENIETTIEEKSRWSSTFNQIDQ